MDPWAPINGISLERYAELSAELGNTTDANAQAEIVAKLGVARPDWEAAKAGWMGRMQDMSLMGQVATRYVPLYQAALARKSGGAPQVTFEDYIAMSGCVPVMGFQGMLAHYKITSTQWTMIAGHWNSVIPTNPQYMQFGLLVEQEAQRIRSGGAPKPVSIGGPAPAGAPAQPAAPAAYAQPGVPVAYPGAPAAYAQPGAPAAYPQPGAQAAYAQPGVPAAYPGAPAAYPQQPGYPQAGAQAGYPQPGYPQHNPYAGAQNAGAQLGNAFNAFGSAVGSFVEGAVGAFSVGARVMVAWSDGRRYPGTVANTQPGQLEIAFPDGRRVWVPQQYVSATW